MASPKTDALYVKFKANSPITVNRQTVNSMAEHFAQDATFVTHLALARLRDDIAAGVLDASDAIPMAMDWVSPSEAQEIRARVEREFRPSNLTWKKRASALADALAEA